MRNTEAQDSSTSSGCFNRACLPAGPVLDRDELMLNDQRFSIQNRRKEADGETALKSDGWRPRFYKLSSGDFRFKKTALALSDDLFVEDSVLDQGSLRIDGVLDAGELQICFVESNNYRLLGYTAHSLLQSVCYDRSYSDITLCAPAQITTLNATKTLTEKIIFGTTSESLQRKLKFVDGRNGRKALVLSMTPQSALLLKLIKRCFTFMRSNNFDGANSLLLSRMRHDLIEATTSLIDRLTEAEGLNLTLGQTQRRAIAREIENTLWLSPTELENVASLNDFSKHFCCSRRSIQQAVFETFGVSYTTLKRTIRLHQVKFAIGATKNKSMACIGYEHDFNNSGRFAAYYKEFFGISPNQARREIELKQQMQEISSLVKRESVAAL